jgi:8-oxo-dGTP diphosphatase
MSEHQRAERPGVGVGVVVRRGEEVLLVRRKHHGAGTWAAPGGYLDQGESFEACAAREVREETGVEIDQVRVVAVANDIHDDGKHNVTVWLLARHASGEARLAAPDEAEAVAWFPRDRLPPDLYRSTRNFVEGRTHPPTAGSEALGGS